MKQGLSVKVSTKNQCMDNDTTKAVKKEEIKNTIKTKYEQVSERLDRDGYISDRQLVNIWGDETGIYKSSEHIRRWKKLKSDRSFFADKKIVEKRKGHRCHLVRLENEPANSWYKVGKDFYNEITL